MKLNEILNEGYDPEYEAYIELVMGEFDRIMAEAPPHKGNSIGRILASMSDNELVALANTKPILTAYDNTYDYADDTGATITIEIEDIAQGLRALRRAKRAENVQEGYRNLDNQAQKVWSAKTLEDKKKELSSMISGFKYKEKAEKFQTKVDNETSLTKLDKLAADLMQISHGNKVV